MSKLKDDLYLQCRCGLPDHLVVFRKANKSELWIFTQLNNFLPWWRRIVFGIRYILGLENSRLGWDETLLNLEDIKEIHNYIHPMVHSK